MTITWREDLPSVSSNASVADDELRDFMVAVASGLSRSFQWPGSGVGSTTSAGLSQKGNARLAVADNTAVVGGYGDGFLLLNRNHVSLHHIGSTWTAMLGHANMVDHAPPIGFPAAVQIAAHWVTQSGTYQLDGLVGFGGFAVTFPTAYSEVVPPFVRLAIQPAAAISVASTFILQIDTITKTGFTSTFSAMDGVHPAMTIYWESNGTVLL